MKRSESGFTLVEMLVALLLFGIIASIAAALTASATKSFARSQLLLADIGSLEGARATLAADLGQAAQRPSIGADGKRMPAFLLLPEGFVLVRRGLTGTVPAVEKVAWGFDGHNLLRQTFPAVDGAPPGRAVVMVRDVAGIRLRVAGERGWQGEWRPEKPEALPRALEMVIARTAGPPVTLKLLVGA